MVGSNKPLEIIKGKMCHFIIFITEYWHFANFIYELKNILMKLMGKNWLLNMQLTLPCKR